MQPTDKPHDARQTIRRFVASQTLQLSMAIACLSVVRQRIEQGKDPVDALGEMDAHLNLRLQALAMQAADANNPATAAGAVKQLLSRVSADAAFKAVTP